MFEKITILQLHVSRVFEIIAFPYYSFPNTTSESFKDLYVLD